MKDDTPVPIDHKKVTDGFSQLRGREVYVPLSTFCGVCDDPIELTPREQKYLLEVKGVPVKMLQRGAAFCQRCAKRRARINYLAREERWRQEPDGKAELEQLRMEERANMLHSRERFRGAKWPYGAA